MVPFCKEVYSFHSKYDTDTNKGNIMGRDYCDEKKLFYVSYAMNKDTYSLLNWANTTVHDSCLILFGPGSLWHGSEGGERWGLHAEAPQA